MTGLKLAALYSLPPCRLGFCGAKTKDAPKILIDFLQGKKISQDKVKNVLKNFEVSHPYYKLIAKVNKITNISNYRVVEAYWLGNSLLDKVKVEDLKKLILKEFTKPGLLTKKQAEEMALSIPKDAKPHHSFHVFFIGSVTGRVYLTGKLLDVCRVGWGKVIRIKNPAKRTGRHELRIMNNVYKIIVKYRPLVAKNNKYFLGKPIEKDIVWDKKFLPKVKAGDVISFHWGRVCQVLTKIQQKNLLKYTLCHSELVSESIE